MHPDIAADFGAAYTGSDGPQRLLARIIELTTKTPAVVLPNGDLDHWSLHKCGERRAKMV